MDNQTRPTHQVVADRLDLTVATVSRLRSGERLPSLDTMTEIKEMTGWSLDLQALAKSSGTYHVELETRLAAWWERNQGKPAAART